MPEFKCPRCGGWAFGTRTRKRKDGSFNTDIVECHSWQDGTCSSNEFFMHEPGWLASMKRTKGFKLCGWRGERDEAFTGDAAWQAETYRKRMELRTRLESGE